MLLFKKTILRLFLVLIPIFVCGCSQTNENVKPKKKKKHKPPITTLTSLKEYLNKDFPSKIISVSAAYNSKPITIKGHVSGVTDFKDVGLAEIPMWKHVDNLKTLPTFIPLKSANFTKVVDRFASDGHDRILSAWAIVRKAKSGYELLSALHYVDDSKINSKYHYPKVGPVPSWNGVRKGVQGLPVDNPDTKKLGVSSAIFNVVLSGVLYAKDGPGRVPFKYAEKTWYADVNGYIKQLDNEIKAAYDKGMLIDVIILVPVNKSSNKNTWLAQASYPTAQASAHYAMPNFTTEEGTEAYAAAIDYLAKRYSTPQRGIIDGWVMHNEINDGYVWTNANPIVQTKYTYMDLYIKSMRTAQILSRLYNPHSITLISLDHNWDRRSNAKAYKGRELLNLLVKFSKKEGNFQWGIAFHPYAQDLLDPTVWIQSQSPYSYDAPYVTFKNLEVLEAWSKQDRVRYKGNPRVIEFTEQGVSSPDYSKKSLTEQAASMAYICKKVASLGKNVKALDYFIWKDVPALEKQGLGLGLRKTSNAPKDPSGKKPIWYVYQACGTSNFDKVADKYKSVLGIKSWDEIPYNGPIN